MDQSDCYCKSIVQLTQDECNTLLDIQSDFEYEVFKTSIGPDGNYLYREFDDTELPDWFFDKFGKFYNVEHRLVWLKNWGSVSKHKDVNRHCSITIPLTVTNCGTDFWDDNDNLICTLMHNGEAYLQNNQVVHGVGSSLQARNFLQITFKDHTYYQIKEMFNDNWQ